MTFNKDKIFQIFKEQLEKKIMSLTEEALAQHDAATNEESKAENKYDTRGLEASYIAQAHAERITEMKEGLYLLNKITLKAFDEKIKVGDLVHLTNLETDEAQYFFMLPTGGIEITHEKKKIRSLSPISPLGTKLLGLSIDDEFVLNKKDYVIEKVQ